MTRKSASRRAADAARAQANGGKAPSARVVREKSTRIWYELKVVHARSQAYIEQLAERMTQYANPFVLLKIAKNGDDVRWNELQKDLQTKAAAAGIDFQSLYDLHKDKKKLCLSHTELEQAMRIMDAYQAFDTDFFLNFSPIISSLNEIFNKALKQLLDAQDELAKKTADETAAKLIDPTVVSDVNYQELKSEDLPLPEKVEPLSCPTDMNNSPSPVFQGEEIKAPNLHDAIHSFHDSVSASHAEDVSIDPSVRHGLIQPNI